MGTAAGGYDSLFIGVSANATYMNTHLMMPLVNFSFGSIAIPFSTTLPISNTASAMAHAMKMDASARWMPARIKFVNRAR